MLILDNCLIFDGTSPDLLDGCSIIIEQGVIQEIGKAGYCATGTEATILDMGGRFVMPGLIDAHFHAYWFDWSGATVDRAAPQTRALHAKAILEKTLRQGFTTVRDAAGGDYSLWHALGSGLIDGPRFFYSGLALGQTGGHADPRPPNHVGPGYNDPCGCGICSAFSSVVDGPDAMRRAARDQLRQGAHQIKLHVSGGILSPSDPYWMNQLTDLEIQAAVEEAATRRTYVMAHSITNESVLRCIRNGVRSIEHATMIERDGARAIVENNAFAVPTLCSIEALKHVGPGMGIPKNMMEKLNEVAQYALSSLDILRQVGAQIGFGTDLCGTALEWQLQEFRIRSEVCSALEILRSATSQNAALLQMKGKLGVVAPRAFADLVVLDGNPLEDIHVMECASNYAMVMRNGQVITNKFCH